MSEKQRPASERAPNPTAGHALKEHETSVGSAPQGRCPGDQEREAGIHAPLPVKPGKSGKPEQH